MGSGGCADRVTYQNIMSTESYSTLAFMGTLFNPAHLPPAPCLRLRGLDVSSPNGSAIHAFKDVT